MKRLAETATVTELEQFGVSTKTLNLLDEIGILYLRQLLAYRKQELLRLPNIGDSTVDELLGALQRHREHYRW